MAGGNTPSDTLEQRYARAKAIWLTSNIVEADKELKANKLVMAELDEQLAPTLQTQLGFGAETVA